MTRYLNEKEVSEITGIALQTLRNNRMLNKGFPYVRVGRSIRYSLEDVIAYMESRKVKPKNDGGNSNE